MWPDWAIYWILGNFSKPVATISLLKSPTFLGNFCKRVRILIFSSEIIFGQLLCRHLATFYWSHWPKDAQLVIRGENPGRAKILARVQRDSFWIDKKSTPQLLLLQLEKEYFWLILAKIVLTLGAKSFPGTKEWLEPIFSLIITLSSLTVPIYSQSRLSKHFIWTSSLAMF